MESRGKSELDWAERAAKTTQGGFGVVQRKRGSGRVARNDVVQVMIRADPTKLTFRGVAPHTLQDTTKPERHSPRRELY